MKSKRNLEEPHKLELQNRPIHLKYAYFGEGEILPIILASNLEKK